jgi:hypothetical protein
MVNAGRRGQSFAARGDTKCGKEFRHEVIDRDHLACHAICDDRYRPYSFRCGMAAAACPLILEMPAETTLVVRPAPCLVRFCSHSFSRPVE